MELPEWKAAQEAGAAAILQRANVAFSIHSIFARSGEHSEMRKIRIPIAYISNEDVDLFKRLTEQDTETYCCII